VALADAVRAEELLLEDSRADALDMTRHPGTVGADPYVLVADELAGLNSSIRSILGIDHPVLSKVARYFFDSAGAGGKKMRPAMGLLMSQAGNHHMAGGLAGAAGGAASLATTHARGGLAAAMSRVANARVEGGEVPRVVLPLTPSAIMPLQRRLAEITEMIHTASLLHDDVIDMAELRRGMKSVNSVFGNKLAVLAGDFLLARASVCLARLRNIPVVELMSTVIEHLVKGEVMQMKTALRAEAATMAAFHMYLRKSYYKTGSLMANSCKSIALLGCYPDAVADAAFRYGMHAGVAFQLVDDLLGMFVALCASVQRRAYLPSTQIPPPIPAADFEGSAAQLGKPAMNDMKQGLATAPVLFAAQQFPTLLPIIERKFEAPGDVDAALRFVAAADGLRATRRLAIAHGQMALRAIEVLEPSPARTALAALVMRVLARDK